MMEDIHKEILISEYFLLKSLWMSSRQKMLFEKDHISDIENTLVLLYLAVVLPSGSSVSLCLTVSLFSG